VLRNARQLLASAVMANAKKRLTLGKLLFTFVLETAKK